MDMNARTTAVLELYVLLAASIIQQSTPLEPSGLQALRGISLS